MDSAFFCEESGVQESTTLTLDKEHNKDLGGISITLVERLHTLTGTLTVVPGDFKETTLGHIVRSPYNEESICSVTAVSISPSLRTIP